MLPEDVVIAVRRMEKRLLEFEAGNQASLRRVEQKLESLTSEMTALKKPPEQPKPAATRNSGYPNDIPSLVPAQVPRVYRQKTKEGEWIIA